VCGDKVGVSTGGVVVVFWLCCGGVLVVGKGRPNWQESDMRVLMEV
jgi:hypothetical protein